MDNNEINQTIYSLNAIIANGNSSAKIRELAEIKLTEIINSIILTK